MATADRPPLTVGVLKFTDTGAGGGGGAGLAVMVMGADVALPPTLSVTFRVTL